jgi:hypothetical protein
MLCEILQQIHYVQKQITKHLYVIRFFTRTKNNRFRLISEHVRIFSFHQGKVLTSSSIHMAKP